ncbi:MAG: hypothetical protein ACO1OB_32420 [Archangium sp.]
MPTERIKAAVDAVRDERMWRGRRGVLPRTPECPHEAQLMALLDALEPEHLETVMEHLLRETSRRLRLDTVMALPTFPAIDQDNDLPEEAPGTYSLVVSFDCWHARLESRGNHEKRLIHAHDLLA